MGPVTTSKAAHEDCRKLSQEITLLNENAGEGGENSPGVQEDWDNERESSKREKEVSENFFLLGKQSNNLK